MLTKQKINVDYIVVADLFKENYIGGAELTLDSILSACPNSYHKIHSSNVTQEFVEKHTDKYWILGNISQLTKDSMIEIATTTKYSKIECDYFYCKFRSPQLHKLQTGLDCDCHTTDHGRFILGLYKRAQKVFFMSSGQLKEHIKVFPSMNNWSNKLVVQGSTFDKDSLNLIKQIADNHKEKNGRWFIQGGGNTSWIKNTEGCISHCKQNNLSYDVVSGLAPEQFLNKLAEYKGLVFIPKGWDTNPRITIEAKLLGLELILGEYVQQKDDDWFNQSVEDLFVYLYKLPELFWKNI